MRTTVIVGASSGIGESLAKLLLDQGQQVISISRNTPRVKVTKHYTYDVLSELPFPELDTPVDGLVYCPGSINLKPIRGLKEADYMADFKLNTLGAIKFIQAYQKLLQNSTNASIVLFSTIAVQTGMAYHSSVAVSKGAIEGLTRSLAAEFAPKIRVNCIAPSLTDTPLANKLISTPEKLQASANMHPLKRIGSADDIANAADYLLSDRASWVSGQILHIDGGSSKLKTT
ncbi:MAG: SDR family NAD(P)-dependent oxidoreductase [Sphingobacteriaceae bacterium]|jgi:3-oxoacyl-[acyl-carrier protein] reductase